MIFNRFLKVFALLRFSLQLRLSAPCWAILASSWGLPGRSWGALGACVGHLGGLFGHLGALLAGLGAHLGHLGANWGHLGSSSGPLGQPWGHVGASMVHLGGHLGPIIPTAWAMSVLFDAILGLSGQSCGNLGAILDPWGANGRFENDDFGREVYQK